MWAMKKRWLIEIDWDVSNAFFNLNIWLDDNSSRILWNTKGCINKSNLHLLQISDCIPVFAISAGAAGVSVWTPTVKGLVQSKKDW